ETSSGWQQVNFGSPVAITANTTYVASYHTNVGHYSADENYFASRGVDSPPLHALANGADGPNGVYAYSASSVFPSSTYNSTNYWVDVLFAASGGGGTGPSVTSVSPANAATGVMTGTSVTATFSQAMDASTINNTTFRLLDPSNSPVAASVTYNSTTQTATLTPSAPLSFSTKYNGVVQGGSSGVKDSSGNALAADFTWSFTTWSGSCPCSIWSSSAVPGTPDSGPDSAVELGVKFRSDVGGFITGVRFYKGTGNTGTHVGNL